MRKKTKRLFEQLIVIIQTYIEYNLIEEPVDGLFISEDSEVTLEMLDDIDVRGDFFPMETLMVKREDGGITTYVPDENRLMEIAEYYSQ